MELTIKGTPKEIADLVNELQSQQAIEYEDFEGIKKNTEDILKIKQEYSKVLENVRYGVFCTLQNIAKEYSANPQELLRKFEKLK